MRIKCGYSEEEEAEEKEEVEEEEEDYGVQWGYRGVQRGYDVPLLSSLPSVATILLPLLKRVSTCFIQKWTCPNVSEMMHRE